MMEHPAHSAPLIFRDALKSLRAKAETSVFIDDVESYVNGARTLGMYAIHYQNSSQLRSELAALGANFVD